MQAIILCGGLGTRLRSVIGENQKTMTEINGEPFVVNVIKHIKKYGVNDIMFSTGYKSDDVEKFFGKDFYFGMQVSYAKEESPLGTGGAIRNCLSLIKGTEVLVVNGDTLFPCEIDMLLENFKANNADISIACKSIEDKTRYGTIVFKDEKTGIIDKFDEKKEDSDEESYINGGVYIMKKSLIESINQGEKISLEKDLIPKWLTEGKVVSGIVSNESFIDIGTPESLQQFKDANA